ncbi:MAG: hypothetical protein QNJ64_16435 [Crocosphaera sp.]|nr:hypothetical protein [Crocosphaera sp.]
MSVLIGNIFFDSFSFALWFEDVGDSFPQFWGMLTISGYEKMSLLLWLNLISYQVLNTLK